VPRVVGLPVDRSVNTVSQEGFPVPVSRLPNRATPGDVISQSPAARQSASKNTTAELVVSTGEFAAKVPDVSGQKVDGATSSVQDAGFVVVLIGQANAGAPGTVFQTEPPAGEVAALGSDVQVMVSKGPATIVPSDEKVGNVVAQNPAAGTPVDAGASVHFNTSGGR
jgi:beta-lactam-binding protein with PASTA domain